MPDASPWGMHHTLWAALRVAVGLGLIIHGFGHAVFPGRGFGAIEASGLERALANTAWATALLGFLAAGLGTLGAWPFRSAVRASVVSAAMGSGLALALAHQRDLWWAVPLDVLAVFLAWRISEAPRRSPVVGAVARRRRWLNTAAHASAIAVMVWFAGFTVFRPWHHRWGATDAELGAALPGDWPNRNAAFEVNHAISIAAPPSQVWPWLAQIGQDRGGFYSYSWLENLFGLRIQNADRIHPEWQTRQVGDLVRAAPPGWLGGLLGNEVGWRVSLFVPRLAIGLEHWGTFVVLPDRRVVLPDRRGEGTRLIVRSKFADPTAPVWGSALGYVLLDGPHFIMERQMLRTIKRLAEEHRATAHATPVATADPEAGAHAPATHAQWPERRGP